MYKYEIKVINKIQIFFSNEVLQILKEKHFPSKNQWIVN